MVKSMTGYGRARETRNGRDITVEVRSVNNRYLDCTVKMPRAYIFAEDAVKTLVQKYVSRGKVDVFVSVDSLGAEETVVKVNDGAFTVFKVDESNFTTIFFVRFVSFFNGDNRCFNRRVRTPRATPHDLATDFDLFCHSFCLL